MAEKEKRTYTCDSGPIERAFVRQRFAARSQENIECYLGLLDRGTEDEPAFEDHAGKELDKYMAKAFQQKN